MSFNNEEIFQLLQQNKWDELLNFESKNRAKIISDPLLKQVFDTFFIDALILDLNNKNDHLNNYIILKRIYSRFLQHYDKTYNIPKEKFEKIVLIFLESLESQNELKMAYSVAKSWSHLLHAKEIISSYEQNQLQEINHSTDETIKVSINPNVKKENHSINLFKSKQEYEFYYAIREHYPNYLTYPNVALSCLMDYQKIENNLNTKEKDYFFKAVIDNVVFIQSNDNFEPKFYFELDSIYHDTDKQKKNDKIKDKIFSLSGQKLIRIRHKNNLNLKREDFKKLIQEVLKEL